MAFRRARLGVSRRRQRHCRQHHSAKSQPRPHDRLARCFLPGLVFATCAACELPPYIERPSLRLPGAGLLQPSWLVLKTAVANLLSNQIVNRSKVAIPKSWVAYPSCRRNFSERLRRGSRHLTRLVKRARILPNLKRVARMTTTSPARAYVNSHYIVLVFLAVSARPSSDANCFSKCR